MQGRYEVRVPEWRFRSGDIEAGTCDFHLLQRGELRTAVIVRWCRREIGEPYCYVLAYWIGTREGYDLKFVGSRPFDEEIDEHAFWLCAKSGQEVLDAAFADEENRINSECEDA